MKEVLGKSYKLKIDDEAEKYMDEHTIGEVYVIGIIDGNLQIYKEKEQK